MKGRQNTVYIRELIIEEFAGKLGEKITLTDGFNLILGANETGKSTVCAFIKFIFYGFTDAKERDRYSSIKTGNSSGAMVVEHNGKVYRIMRRASGRIQTAAIYDEESGTEFTDWQATCDTPGDFFLGIPSSLYGRSIYVSQTDGSYLDGGSAEAISNLLLTGDEAVNLKRARRTLEEARKTLKLKRGTGGIIHECQSRISALKAEKENALKIKQELEFSFAALNRENAYVQELTKQINDAKKALELSRARKIRAYLGSLEKAYDANKKAQILEDDLIKSCAFNGFLPDGDYQKRITELSGQLKLYEDEIKELSDKLHRLSTDIGLTAPKEYGAYCSLGKSAAIFSEYEKHRSLFRTSNIAFLVSIILTFVSLVATVLGALNVFKPNPFIHVILALSAVGIAGFCFLKLIPKKALKRLDAALGVTVTKTHQAICLECEKYEQRLSGGQAGYVAEALKSTKIKAAALKSALDTELKKWNKTSSEDALRDYRTFVSKKEQIKEMRQSAENEISVTKAYLSVYSEDEIASAGALSYSGSADIDYSSEAELDRLNSLLNEAIQRQNELNVAIAGHNSSLTDIEQLDLRIENEEELLADYTAKLVAITLAQNKLDEAESNIRKTVSPYLSEHSTAYFTKITNGDYSALKLDSEMNLSYIQNGESAPISSAYFSAGSSDLAWLCLRLALHKRLSENIRIPIILDEALVYFDETRLTLILAELLKISQRGTQLIMLSASERELNALPSGIRCLRLEKRG